MTVFSIITLLGGLAFFLYGMGVMSQGLGKLSGGKLERTLKKMTSNPFKSLLLGAGITIAIQSSSAMTVMLVGLVNSGIMQLSQTIGVIMGSNIGTTLTAWILSLAGIQSTNVLILLLKPENFAPIMALVGVLMNMISNKQRKKDIGTIMVGFAVLMYGMTLMSDAVSPLANMPEFQSIMTAFNNPILGVAVGAIFTGIIQSSAASVGILQALSLTGSVTYGMAIPLIMGQNIGTCVTAIISGINVNRNAKRVAMVHIIFNIIGTVICLVIFTLVNSLINLSFIDLPISPVGIALVHSIFNVFTTAILLPFAKLLEKVATALIPDKKDKAQQEAFIDERLFNTPSFAVAECNSMTKKMCTLSCDTIRLTFETLKDFDQAKADIIRNNEDELDKYEDKLGTYLIKLSSMELSERDSKQISKMLHTIGDFERIGDHALNLLNSASEISEKGLVFSEQAKTELAVLISALNHILDLTQKAFVTPDLELAARVEPLEQVIDHITAQIKVHHIERLQAHECTIQMGFVLSDMLNNYERISDHCSNIAVALIEVDHNCFDTHEYLNAIKDEGNKAYNSMYTEFLEKFKLA